jgi:opacity protein-like surface antigen
MRLRWLTGLGLLAVASGAQAADFGLPTKAPPPATRYDWSGFYLGGHIGYAGGSSHWTTSGVSGSFGLYQGFDVFKDTQASVTVRRLSLIAAARLNTRPAS